MPTSEVARLPPAPSWAWGAGPERDVVVASRARLSRNLAGTPFPHDATDSERRAVERQIMRVVRDSLCPSPFGAGALDLVPERLSRVERSFLAERSLLDTPVPWRILATEDERLAVQIGAVDHLRIVGFASGLAASRVLELVRDTDRRLEDGLNYAVAMDWGYLSSEITNLGTALCASTMVHLPALSLLGQTESISDSLRDSGYELVPFPAADRVATGEVSAHASRPAAGQPLTDAALYLLRNRRTIGSDEVAIVTKLEEYTATLVHYERGARQELLASRGEEISDSANRALGVLRFARCLPAEEAVALISRLRLGVVAEVVPGISTETVTTLLFINQDNHVEQRRAHEGNGEDGGTVRARIFREMLGANRAD